MKNITDKLCRENQNTHFMFNHFLPENRPVDKIMWKSEIQPDWSQRTIQYGACALHAGYLRQEYRSTLRIRNTFCFSTATMVARTRLNVMLYVHCLSCCLLRTSALGCLWLWTFRTLVYGFDSSFRSALYKFEFDKRPVKQIPKRDLSHNNL